MLTQITLIMIAVFLGGPLSQARRDEDGARRFDQRAQRSEDEADGDRQERRREWREQMQKYRSASPEERRQLRLERYVVMTARMYELDDTQKGVVRNEIQMMAEERRAAMGPDAEDYDRVRDQMAEFWAAGQHSADGKNDPGDPRSRWQEMRRDPKFRELRDRMREFETKYPFDWQASMARIEKLLPEKQVEKARAKWQDRRGWTERRDRERRNRGDRPDDIKTLRERAERAGKAGDLERSKRLLAEADRRAAVLGERDTLTEGKPEETPPAPRPIHPWEKYAQEFGERHDLSPGQAASVDSILKESLTRAGQIESANAARIAEAERIEDSAVREKRLAELNRPIEQLFDELKMRLDGLLTAAQRGKPV